MKKAEGAVGRAAGALMDFAFPPSCPCCGRLTEKDRPICGECEEKLVPARLSVSPPEGCEYSASAFVYDGPAKSGVLSMKDGAGRAFAAYTAELLAPRVGSSATLVTSVPMHALKRLARGSDQAEVFGRMLAERLGLPYKKGLLRCRLSLKRQHDLAAPERRIHAESIFEKAPDAESLEGQRVIICDDILTTGSTLSVCARLLLELGAKEVGAVTVCRTSPPEEKRKNE
ncbi:MAG: ComF family protein [Ruminococcus sp.]|nr:ComF family protein [Ruminococcus sp.]